METVCHGKQWDVALAYDEQQNIVGALPYLMGSKMGLRYILQPQLTQYNGPWYREGTDQGNTTRQLTAHLKKLHLALYLQNFAPSVTHFAGWEKYEVSPRPTYRIDDITNPQQVFDNFDKHQRQKAIRRAQKVLHIDEDITPDQFATLHAEYWQSRGKADLLSHDFIQRVVSTAVAHGNGILIAARDAEGRLHGARFAVYDSRCGYSLMCAFHPEGHHNATSSFLLWEIFQRLASRTRSFDFEGSREPSIALSYSLYGSYPATYHQVFRSAIPFAKKLLKIQ